MKRGAVLALLLPIVLLACGASAQSRSVDLFVARDPRGDAELTICSQNMNNLGTINDVKAINPEMTVEDLEYKTNALVKRFVKGKCDVIAVQELVAKNEHEGEVLLQGMADVLRRKTNRIFDVRASPSNDNTRRLGFLVAKDRAEIMSTLSYARIGLPKLLETQKPRFFARGPFEVQLGVKPLQGSFSKTVVVVTFHFKSKRGGKDDPTGLEWETWRMEMAEALRRIIESRHQQALSSGNIVLVLLGDRNSNFDSASAKILEGVLTLKHFQGTAPCRLSKRGIPLCQAGKTVAQKLFSVLTGDPQTKLLHGTFIFDKVYSWLDEIAMPAESLPFAWQNYDSTGDYASGVLSEYGEASDHAMVYVKLNW